LVSANIKDQRNKREESTNVEGEYSRSLIGAKEKCKFARFASCRVWIVTKKFNVNVTTEC